MSEQAAQTEPAPMPLGGRRVRARKTSHLLRVYRHVFKTHTPKHKNGKAKKESPDVTLVRNIKEKTPSKFSENLERLEQEYAASRISTEPGSVQMDEGSKKALSLVAQLLEELAAKRTQTPTPRQA